MSDDKEMIKLFGERLTEAMNVRGFTGSQLSKLSDIDGSNISRYKKGLYAPKRDNIYKIAKCLNVNPMWLLGYSEDMEYVMPGKDMTINKIENKLETMDKDQLEKTLRFIEEYIIK